MDERVTRIWAGSEARSVGAGGIQVVVRATGLSRTTVSKGSQESAGKPPAGTLVKVRRAGAGRPPVEVSQPGVDLALDAMVDPVTRGDPESPLRWTTKSTRELSAALEKQNFRASPQTVGLMLAGLGYSLQGTSKALEGEQHPDRDEQFKFINARAKAFQREGEPVISVDTKKKELVGEFGRNGKEWQPVGAPVLASTHDFPNMARGKAIPYGVYDVAANTAWVSVGQNHDTPRFAVNSIRTWWSQMGSKQYADARKVFITADAGGSNSARSRVWKAELQKFSNETGLEVSVAHFPPGTSKWNKVEHRLFSHITMNWRGRPLEDYQTVVELIGSTKTRTGLKVRAGLDRRRYRTGVKVPKKVMAELNIKRAKFHGEWNYTLSPQVISNVA